MYISTMSFTYKNKVNKEHHEVTDIDVNNGSNILTISTFQEFLHLHRVHSLFYFILFNLLYFILFSFMIKAR